MVISERQGIEPAMQRLIFGGTQLEDGKASRYYGLGPDMTVHLGELSFGSPLMVLAISSPAK